jgi:hypothetical protein
MGSIINKSVRNLFFVAFFTLVILSQFFVSNNIVLNYWFPIFCILFFIAAFPYLDFPKTFITLALISWISSFIAAKLFLGHFYGYDVIFILLYLKIFSISSATGFITAKFFSHYLNKNLFNKKKVLVLGGAAVSLLVAITTFITSDVSVANKLKIEVKKRIELARNITLHYGQTSNKSINNKVIIEQRLIKDLYSAKEETITHGFNGDIKIVSDINGISLIYENIPEGEACYWFYFMDSPSTYGFDDTFINEVLVNSRINYKSIKNGKELCYSTDNNVTIRYTASYKGLKRTLKFIQ